MAIDRSIQGLIAEDEKFISRITRNFFPRIECGNLEEAMDRSSIDKLLASLE